MATALSTPRPGFITGVRHVGRAFALLRVPGVRRYVIVPLLLNVLLFALALVGLGQALDYLIAQYLAGWPAWIQRFAWFLFAVLAASVVFFTFSLVANIVASPFNGLLAEAVERHLRGEIGAPAWTWRRLARELGRTLWSELRKLAYVAWRALPLLVLSVIPVVNALAPPLWLLFGAWMLCLEYLDCPLGNHGRVFPSVLGAMRRQRSLALGFGAAMTVVTLLPLLNFLAMPLGVAGATSLYCAHLAAPDTAT